MLDAGTRGHIHTLRSAPDDFKFAQSNAPCPGASATFSRFLDGFTGRTVCGTARDDAVDDGREIWGFRLARFGGGGGGMSWESVSTRGMPEGCMRCALKGLGNAGGESSSCSVSVSVPSSSSLPSGGGENRRTVGVWIPGGSASTADVPVVSQLRKYEVMMV